MRDQGRLILVVGPSGAGKDTLLREASARLMNDDRFLFPRRMVTRTAASEVEDHHTISRSEFETLCSQNATTLAWEAHGLGYVIPSSAREAAENGKIVVCNGSRQVVGVMLERYPQSAAIVVTADKEIRAARIFARGRETEEQIHARLEREAPTLPQSDRIVLVDNSGDLENAITAFIDALQRVAEPQVV